jgi:hypothetical protein
MTTPLLSPAAQAVLDAAGQVPVPNGLAFPLIRLEIAAAIRALVEQVLPEEICPTRDGSGDDAGIDELLSRMIKRADILGIAAELDGGQTQPTPTETPNE